MIILHDAARRQWLLFQEPVQVIELRNLSEILPALRRIEDQVDRQGLYAAGFLGYEAAPAFDPAFRTRPPGDFPLLWFGLYPPPTVQQEFSIEPAAYSLNEWVPSVRRDEYDQAIARIKDFISLGETYQVNYTFRLNTAFAGDARSLFQDLVRAQPTDYAAFVDTGRFAICSASPELFFRQDGDRIVARPMKGTARRGRTPIEDNDQAGWLRNSEKNRSENVMIVDMIRNDLGRIARSGSVSVTSMFDVERYPTLWQMTSTVTAMTTASVAQVLSALFPCASITGAPKVRTMGIIADLETGPRRIYTGCIGFIGPGRTAQFNVAIRTLLVDRREGRAEYGVGGGIVWDSTAQDEYAECQTKARLLTHAPVDFSLMEALLWQPHEGYFLLPYHLRRLSLSAEYFDFRFEPARVRNRLDELAAALKGGPHKVRLLLARDGKITCSAEPLSAIPKPDPSRLRLAKTPVDSEDVFLYHKTTQRKIYEAALAACPDCDDVLLWNERGEITETDSANVVVRLNGKLYTPPVTCGLLAGTFRAWLLERGEVEERVIEVNELAECEEIYLVNSIRRWRGAILVD